MTRFEIASYIDKKAEKLIDTIEGIKHSLNTATFKTVQGFKEYIDEYYPRAGMRKNLRITVLSYEEDLISDIILFDLRNPGNKYHCLGYDNATGNRMTVLDFNLWASNNLQGIKET